MPKCILAEQAKGGGGGIDYWLMYVEVTKTPNKTSYLAEETFDPSGMEVTAYYGLTGSQSVFNESVVTNYSFSTDPILDGTTKITLSYGDAYGTATVDVPITVTHKLKSIAVTTQPTKTSYVYKENFNSAGMVVTATYSDGAAAAITPKSYSPTTFTTVTTSQNVTVTYTENGVTCTTSLNVSVGKANRSLTANPTTVTINGSNYTSGIAVTLSSTDINDGTLSTGSISGITVTKNSNSKITITGNGSTVIAGSTLTINLSAGTNYNACSTTITVKAEYFTWGNETATANAAWWTSLKSWLANATASEMSAYVGKTKSVTLTSAVQGTTTHLVRCIGYNCDGNKTLTFQTANCLANTTTFGSSNAYWVGSTVRNLCTNYYNAFPGKSAIKTISKGTCATTNSSQAGTPTYNNETVFLPSDCEMGFPKGMDYNNGKGYAASYDEFCKDNTSKTPYQYYTSNDRRVKKLGDSGSAQHYWERSLHYVNASRACSVYTDGKPSFGSYGGSSGFAPAFAIG